MKDSDYALALSFFEAVRMRFKQEATPKEKIVDSYIASFLSECAMSPKLRRLMRERLNYLETYVNSEVLEENNTPEITVA